LALDFVILGLNGAPEKAVAIGVELHRLLISAASDLKLESFRRFADYYEDAEIKFNELPKLAREIEILIEQISPADLRRFLDELGTLVANAMAQGNSIHVIAD
jgi:PII-like signaling protein